MSLVLDERELTATAELVLGDHRMPITCRITIEWLRGIPEPTWYGYLTPLDEEMRILPGLYRLQLSGQENQILLRRPARKDPQRDFPFWGIGEPPTLSPRSVV